MNHLANLRICFLLLLFLVFTCFSGQAWAAEKADPPAKETPAKEVAKTTVIDMLSWSGILSRELIDLRVRIDSSSQDFKAIEDQLPILSQEIKELERETSLVRISYGKQIFQLDQYDLKLSKIGYQLTKLGGPVTQAISEYSKLHKEWTTKKQTLVEMKKQADLPLSFFSEEKKDLAGEIDLALQLIEKQLNPALALGKKIAALQVQVHMVGSLLRKLEFEIRKGSTQQTSPSMLSKEFYARINLEFFKDSWGSLKNFLSLQGEYLQGNYLLVLIGCLGVGLLYWLVRWTARYTPATSPWYPFADCPLATTVFMISVNSAFFAILLMELSLPQRWETFLHILNILSVAKLLKHILKDSMQRQWLRWLAFFLALLLLLIAFGFTQLLIFMYVFYVSIVAVIVYIYQLFKRTERKNTLDHWLRKVWGLVPILILLSGVGGYDQLAIFIFTSCLSSIIVCMTFWMLFKLNIGLLDLACSLLPVELVRNNRSTILKNLGPLILLIHAALAISVLIVIWGGQNTIAEVFASIGKIGFDLGDVRVSPGFIVVVCLVLYVTMLVSRALQAMLLKEILPRYDADTGVQLSISRLVHYAVLTVGFLVMLRALGFKLEQLTLLGGAVGVGLAFGLQAIVNNFASGLILLFERPIKVGDTIQLGDDFGEVKEVGLRATIVRTFDNAEIVVPNSDLITSQVINWTLANRQVRVRVPVGVAYGTDVTKVLNILRGCAEANPMVLNTPKPIALFLAFGPSSLDFELRVWIPDFLEKTQVLSDLNQDIDAEFAANNIEIPFPQTDLHLRSVHEAAAASLRGRPEREEEVVADEEDRAKEPPVRPVSEEG